MYSLNSIKYFCNVCRNRFFNISKFYYLYKSSNNFDKSYVKNDLLLIFSIIIKFMCSYKNVVKIIKGKFYSLVTYIRILQFAALFSTPIFHLLLLTPSPRLPSILFPPMVIYLFSDDFILCNWIIFIQAQTMPK